MSSRTPIIRLTLEGMQHSIIASFTEYEKTICDEIKSSVEKFCDPQNIERILDAEISKSLEKAISEEVGVFFHYGLGRTIINDLINKKLQKLSDNQNNVGL